MHLFYSKNISKKEIQLDAEESRHLVKVLRLTDGEECHVIDGIGNRYHCRINAAHPKKAILTILSKEKIQENFGIHIAAAPTKNLNRWEWFLEKATEMGIDRISPITSFHSERKVLKQDRQERILVSAMKQSYKTTLPQLDELCKFDAFIKQEFEGQKFIAHCYDSMPKKALKDVFKANKPAILLIGPEGDFSEQEVQEAMNCGFQAISMGESRLRTETAAIVACHSIHLLNE